MVLDTKEDAALAGLSALMLIHLMADEYGCDPAKCLDMSRSTLSKIYKKYPSLTELRPIPSRDMVEHNQ